MSCAQLITGARTGGEPSGVHRDRRAEARDTAGGPGWYTNTGHGAGTEADLYVPAFQKTTDLISWALNLSATLTQSEIVEVVEITAPLPAESTSPMFVIVFALQKTIEISQLQCIDNVVDVLNVQVYMFHGSQIVENIVEMFEIPIVQGTKTPRVWAPHLFASLARAEIVELCRDWSMSACRIRVTHVLHGTRFRL